MPALLPTTFRRRAQRLLPLVLLTSCTWLVGGRPLDDARPGGTIWAHMTSGGRTRSFVLHLPPAAAHGPVPLLLAFHGFHGNGAALRETSGMDAAADRRGVAVAYLDGTGPLHAVGLAWNAGTCCGRAQADDVDDVAYAAAVVDRLAQRGLVDRARVWAVGFSNGGMLALRIACERADLVRGAVDVAGSMPDLPCEPSRRVKVMLVEGSDDDELRHDLRTLRRQVRYYGYAASFITAFQFWRDQAGCTGRIAIDSARRTIERRATGCATGGAAELVTIHGHPHAWPGGERTWPFAPAPAQQWDASARLLDFLIDDPKWHNSTAGYTTRQARRTGRSRPRATAGNTTRRKGRTERSSKKEEEPLGHSNSQEHDKAERADRAVQHKKGEPPFPPRVRPEWSLLSRCHTTKA